MSCLVNNANPVIFTFNFQPNNSPNDKRTPMSSILRDVSPNMLFSFLPLYIRTHFFPCEEVGDQIKLRKQSRIKMSFTQEPETEQGRCYSQCQVKIASELLTETDDNGLFSASCIPLRGRGNY